MKNGFIKYCAGFITAILLVIGLFALNRYIENQSDDIIKKVQRHIIIDTQETPTIATVQDPEALKINSPQLFRLIEIGDKLVVYSDRIIIYRPNTDIIVNTYLLNIEDIIDPDI